MQRLAVVYFPSINLDELNEFRQKYDPKWKIIKPHITLVIPLSNISEELLLQHLETITKEMKSFYISLNGLTKSFDNYLFLQVKQGNEKVIRLHEKLYSGILALHLRKDIIFSPHITLGYFGINNNVFNKKLYEKAYDEVKKMNLNINCKVDNLTFIKGDGFSPVTIIKTFHLN